MIFVRFVMSFWGWRWGWVWGWVWVLSLGGLGSVFRCPESLLCSVACLVSWDGVSCRTI